MIRCCDAGIVENSENVAQLLAETYFSTRIESAERGIQTMQKELVQCFVDKII